MRTFKFVVISIITIILHKSSLAQTPNSTFLGVKKIDIHSEILNEDRTLYIYAPDVSQQEKLPVLYILDGRIIGLYQEALQSIQNYPHIVVGIRTRENRSRDMIPVKVDMYENSGKAEKFLQFLTQELIPYVNENYNTNNQNILYGGSNAGLFTTFAMLTSPEHFYGFIASSTTIGHCKNYMYKLLKEYQPESRLDGKYLYINYGIQDPSPRVVGFIEDFNEALTEKFSNYMSIEIKELPNEGHVPAGAILEGLKFINNEN